MTFALSSPFIWTLAGITTSRSHFHDWNPISDVLNKVVRTAVIYMYWMDSNSGNMRVINPSWLVINAQLLHAVEQAHIYKLRTDLSYSESLTIWVWLSVSMVGVVSWKPIPQLTTYHLKTGSWTNTALHNVHFVKYVYLPTEQAETYLKSCVLINYSTYICLCLFGWKVSMVFKETVTFKL